MIGTPRGNPAGNDGGNSGGNAGGTWQDLPSCWPRSTAVRPRPSEYRRAVRGLSP